MYKLMMSLLAVAVLCCWSFAHDGQGAEATTASMEKPAATSMMQPMNNVVKMEKDGKRTALCCCGHEFTVTENAPSMEHSGTLFYMCGEGCKEVAMKATAEENAKTMAAWHEKYDVMTLMSNTHEKDGKQMATCACGAEFTVSETSPRITENGVTMYLCGEGCKEMFTKKTADERMGAEMKVVSGM
jgi:hypothetical protein